MNSFDARREAAKEYRRGRDDGAKETARRCADHFEELWANVLSCVQDSQLSVGDCCRMKSMLAEKMAEMVRPTPDDAELQLKQTVYGDDGRVYEAWTEGGNTNPASDVGAEPSDTDMLDWLEGEHRREVAALAQQSVPSRSLFRSNQPITRSVIRAAMRAESEEPTRKCAAAAEPPARTVCSVCCKTLESDAEIDTDGRHIGCPLRRQQDKRDRAGRKR